jgi:hypothetical protein
MYIFQGYVQTAENSLITEQQYAASLLPGKAAAANQAIRQADLFQV